MIRFKPSVKNIVRRSTLVLMAVVFTSASIASQAIAVDREFFAGNDILFYDPTCAYTGGSDSLEGNEIKEKIWNFLKGEGLSDEQAAGVMGNMKAESNFIPTRFQGDKDFDPWNNNGTSGHAWGLAQWDGGRRFTSPDKGVLGKLKKDKPELVKYISNDYNWAKDESIKAKIPPEDLDALLLHELNYLVQESKSRPVTARGYGDAGNEWNTLKEQKNIDDATVFWHNNFEVSADSAAEVIKNRGGAAKDIFRQFAGKTPTGDGSSSSSSSSSSSGSAEAPVVFLDPGHGGAIPSYIDPQSGFRTAETPNSPESADVLDVANRVKTQLEGAGYTVVMARTTNDQKVKFRDRANAAASAKASIGVSIHTTPGEINQAWPQRVGTYREYGGKRETFNNKETAQKSEAFADIMAKTRTASENHTVTTDKGNVQQAKSFGRGDIPTKGNIPLISLWSPEVPWVYNEIGQDKGTAISESLKEKYAEGITKGIEEALPFTKKDQCGNRVAVGGDFDQTLLGYAWPKYKGLTIDATDAYTTEVIKRKNKDRYIGGIAHPGIDCGGFTTNLVLNSGFDKNYNHGGSMKDGAGPTGTQEAWAKKNWEYLGTGNSIDIGKLVKGDVALLNGHTFIFVGEVDGFDSDIASASLDERAPMAGKEQKNSSGVRWYRKK